MINPQTVRDFNSYVLNFYDELYPQHNFTLDEIEIATRIHINNPSTEFAADSFDREQVRDIIFTMRDTKLSRLNSTEQHSPYNTVNS